MEKTGSGTTKSMKNTGKSSVHIEKRADKSHGTYVSTGGDTVKKKTAKERTENKKGSCRENAQKDTEIYGISGDIPDPAVVSQCLHFCNRGHKHGRGRICHSRRKQDQRQSHSCKNPINSQRLWLRKSIYTEPLGQKYSFYGRKQRKEKTVDRHRQGGNRNISKCFCQADLMQGRKEIALEHTTDKNKRDQCSEKF